MGQLGFFDLSRRYEGLDVRTIAGGDRGDGSVGIVVAAATADPETGEITTAS